MKYLTIFTSFLFLLVAACSSETQPPADQSRTQEEPEPTAQESGPPPAEVGDGSEETPQFVEESDADPEEDADVEKPIMLAQANPPDSSRDWKFEQGKHFFRFQSTQPVVGGPDKIEVAEVFWYGCAHCYDFEPHINQWADSAPENVRFVRIPATWNPLLELHAKLYYTEEVLVNNDKIENPEAFRAAVFNEYHQRRNRLTSEASIQTLFERHGVSADDFRNTWNSFEVSSKLNKAKDLAVRYGISGVPAVVVNGKYRTGSSNDVRGYPMLLEVVDELVARESS